MGIRNLNLRRSRVQKERKAWFILFFLSVPCISLPGPKLRPRLRTKLNLLHSRSRSTAPTKHVAWSSNASHLYTINDSFELGRTPNVVIDGVCFQPFHVHFGRVHSYRPRSVPDLAPSEVNHCSCIQVVVVPLSTSPCSRWATSVNSSLYITTPNITYINQPSGRFQQQPGIYPRRVLINNLKMAF
jgi:hypothetical protein